MSEDDAVSHTKTRNRYLLERLAETLDVPLNVFFQPGPFLDAGEDDEAALLRTFTQLLDRDARAQAVTLMQALTALSTARKIS